MTGRILNAWLVLVMVQVGVDVKVVVWVLVMSLAELIGLRGARKKQHHERLAEGRKANHPWLTETLPVGPFRLSRGPGIL